MSLNVNKSLNGAKWHMPSVDSNAIADIVRAHGVGEIIARLLVARGIAPQNVEGFLRPTLKNNFPDPYLMADMKDCCEFVANAVMSGKKFALFGDFDVDGATSTAFICRFFRALKIEVPIYIPDRMSEGYGPNTGALKTLRDNGADIVILTDCGTTSFEVMRQGKELGLDLVILDHHEAGDTLSDADFTINPKRGDDTSGLDMLAAVGVAMMFCVGVNRALRDAGYYKEHKLDEPQIKDWLDIVALGTVCDMVPLTGVNRLIVRKGFELMASTKNAGLLALMEVSNIKEAPRPYHAGFVFGPRINAGGRIHKSDLGARLLSTDDSEEAKNLAFALQDCNVKRRSMQQDMERQAKAKVEKLGLHDDAVIVVHDESWHPGLAGLVAGRLKDKYKRPACVITYTKNGDGSIAEGRGSGRSVKGVHIAQSFMDAHAAGLLIKGGGHAMAGGFTVSPNKVDDLRVFLCEHIANQSAGEQVADNIEIAGIITVSGSNPALVETVQNHIGPFGQCASEPIFALRNVRIWAADVVGTSHVRAMLSDAEGGVRMKAIAFRAKDTPLGQALLTAKDRQMHIIGALSRNEWQGRVTAEMHIHDGVFV